MRYDARKTSLSAAVCGCIWAQAALADQHALICFSPSEAKELAQIVDRVPKPAKIGDVLVLMRSKGVKCTVVFADVVYKDTVASVALTDDDYDIVRAMVNGREYFLLKLQNGARA